MLRGLQTRSRYGAVQAATFILPKSHQISELCVNFNMKIIHLRFFGLKKSSVKHLGMRDFADIMKRRSTLVITSLISKNTNSMVQRLTRKSKTLTGAYFFGHKEVERIHRKSIGNDTQQRQMNLWLRRPSIPGK